MTEETTNERLAAALFYASKGWRVFPCYSARDGACECYKHAECGNAGKHPRTLNGLKDATTDEAQIRKWWSVFPLSNVAIATGSGLAVLDIDAKGGGLESLEELQERHGAMPDTVYSLTGGGGRHYLFATDQPIRNSASKVAPGIDVRGEGGYIVAPPSLHASGRPYQWEASSDPADTTVAPLPQWLRPLLEANSPKASQSFEMPDAIGSGQRNETLFRAGCSLRAKGLSGREILAALHAMNDDRCMPPLPGEEVDKIAAQCARYEPGSIHGATTPPDDAGPDVTQPPPSPPPPTVRDALARLGESWNEPDNAFTTGSRQLNVMLHGGLRAGDSIGLVGHAGGGKSTLWGQVAYDAAHAGALVFYASVEMPARELAARWIALECFRQSDAKETIAIGHGDLLHGRAWRGEMTVRGQRTSEPDRPLTADERERVRKRIMAAMERVATVQDLLHVEQVPPGCTVQDIRARVAAMRAAATPLPNGKPRPVLVVVDPMQRLYASPSGARVGRALEAVNTNETERVGAVAQDLKNLADVDGVAVLFTSDTTKASLSGRSSAETMRGSYIINHAATMVLGLHTSDTSQALRERLDGPKDQKGNPMGEPLAPRATKEAIEGVAGDIRTRTETQQLGWRFAVVECSKSRQSDTSAIVLGMVPGAACFVEPKPKEGRK